MNKEINVNGMTFKKSSFSRDDLHCVGVHFNGTKIFVVNTKDENKTVCSFTTEEWFAFIQGIKNNEFNFNL